MTIQSKMTQAYIDFALRNGGDGRLWQVFGELSVEIFWVLTLGSVSVAGAVVGEHGSSPNFSSLGRWQVKGHNLHKAEFYCSRQPARPRLEAPVIVSVVGRVIPALHWLLANSTV